VLSYVILRPYLTQSILAYVFTGVAGVMVYISFDELLPSCFRDGQGHHAILGIIIGMVIVSVSLLFL
jgi:ZIP family zinc transporter